MIKSSSFTYLAGILFVLVSLVRVEAVEFELDGGFAPRPDNTFSTFVGGTVYYTESFYSSLSLTYETESEEESEYEDKLTTTLTTETESYSADLDFLGYHLLSRETEFGLAGSLEYMLLDAAEEQLYEADSGYEVLPGSSTLELTNDRDLHVLLPTLDARFEERFYALRLVLGGEYAPAVFVRLRQTADSEPAYPGFTDEGKVTTSGDYVSDQSFSVNGELELQTQFISPSFGFEYVHLPIEYDIATVGGEESVDTLIRELSLDGNLDLTFISFAGFSPSAKLRYDRSWTEIKGQDDVEFEDEWLFYFGFSRTR